MTISNHNQSGFNDCHTCHNPSLVSYPSFWDWSTEVGDPTQRFVHLPKPTDDGERFGIIADLTATFTSSDPSVVAVGGPTTEDAVNFVQGIQIVGAGTATITGQMTLHYDSGAQGPSPPATQQIVVFQCATGLESILFLPNPACSNSSATATAVLNGAACASGQYYVTFGAGQGNNQVGTNLPENSSYLSEGQSSASIQVDVGTNTFNHVVERWINARLIQSGSPVGPFLQDQLGFMPQTEPSCQGEGPPPDTTVFSDQLLSVFQHPRCQNCHNNNPPPVVNNQAHPPANGVCVGCHVPGWTTATNAPAATRSRPGDRRRDRLRNFMVSS